MLSGRWTHTTVGAVAHSPEATTGTSRWQPQVSCGGRTYITEMAKAINQSFPASSAPPPAPEIAVKRFPQVFLSGSNEVSCRRNSKRPRGVWSNILGAGSSLAAPSSGDAVITAIQPRWETSLASLVSQPDRKLLPESLQSLLLLISELFLREPRCSHPLSEG